MISHGVERNETIATTSFTEGEEDFVSDRGREKRKPFYLQRSPVGTQVGRTMFCKLYLFTQGKSRKLTAKRLQVASDVFQGRHLKC